MTEFTHVEHEPQTFWRVVQPGDLVGLAWGTHRVMTIGVPWTQASLSPPNSKWHILSKDEVYLVLKKEMSDAGNYVRVCLSSEEGNIIWSGWNPEPRIKLISRPAE